MSTDFDPAWDSAEILSKTFVSAIEVHSELPSTNDRGLLLASEASLQTPGLVVAHRQTKGRGRGGNSWWAAPGSLTFSLILQFDPDRLPVARWPEMSLTVGSSVCEALARRLPREDVRLKWPNDVYLRGRKVCGVLVEVPAGRSHCVVVGVGINVNNSVAQAPEELAERAIALCDVGLSATRQEVLIWILQALEKQLQDLSRQPHAVRRRWREFDLLLGRCVTVADGQSEVSGTGVGIDDDGALLLRTEAGTRRCYAGVVQTFDRLV